MKIFTLKKNQDGDTECQLDIKGIVLLLLILFGVQLTASMILGGGSVIFTKAMMTDQSRKSDALYKDLMRKYPRGRR